MTRRSTAGPPGISAVDRAFRTEWGPLVATLTRELGDLGLAEDVAQEAFVEASRRWRLDGSPDRPGAWLLVTARRRAIDHLRRRRRFEDRVPDLVAEATTVPKRAQRLDDQLALLLGCCHPALGREAQVALTLRAVSGLTTEQIARAFLVPAATMAKRLVRAKHKIRAAGIAFSVPEPERIGPRIDTVRAVVYAVFTEGHTSAAGEVLVRGSLCDEAIWLAETLVELRPEDAEARGLAALCLLTDARRATRVDDRGRPVLLADQDRSRWDRERIRRGLAHMAAAVARRDVGPYQLQATIAGLHAAAPSFEATDWPSIVRSYDALVAMGGGPVVQLNRAVALAERDGPEAGLVEIDRLAATGQLDGYHYLHSARAELLRRSGRVAAAHAALGDALDVCANDVEADWLRDRRAAIGGGPVGPT